MKIGILTVPFNNNYGGFLQAYALKQVLKDMGHDTVIINRRRNRPAYWRRKVSQILVLLGLRSDYTKMTERLSQYTDLFKQKYLSPITREYYTHTSMKRCMKKEKFDALIVGSDQVWRYKYAQGSIDDYFFSFVNDKQKPLLSYAASFGIDEMDFPEDKKSLCNQLLKRFRAISVRESSAVDLLAELGVPRKKVKVVLDPTLLLDKKVYKTLFPNEDKPDHSYLFTYVLDETPEKTKLINHFLRQHNLVRKDFKAQTGNDQEQLQPIRPVEEWLSGIGYSDFVVTDSFHGTVFSILFNKPFVVYGNGQRGKARFDSLLGMFNLKDRYIDETTPLNENVLNTSIDWTKVNNIIIEKREQSFSFLKEALLSRPHIEP